MANPEHLEILSQGIRVWNKWRAKNADVTPDFSEANLELFNLDGVFDLKSRAYVGANLSGANLSGAQLYRVTLSKANLSKANLKNANVVDARLWKVDLSMADLTGANLRGTKFNDVELAGANLSYTHMAYTQMIRTDLSMVIGLDTVRHNASSSIDIDSLYKSGGNIPEAFLQGIGVPDKLITYLPSLISAEQAIQFYSCFISYSTKDEAFARRLHSRMRDEKLRVWFAPEDVKGGEKLYEQIERAIQVHDRLLIVLSESSLQSKWVMTEIRRARKVELAENRRKMFPIRLVDFNTLQSWECFDADTGEDLAAEVRQYFIPDFSNWKDHDSFENAFNRLLRDLKAEEK